MTLDKLKKATMIAIKKPRLKQRLLLADNEWRFTLKITSDTLRFNGIYMSNIDGTVTVDWGDGTVGPASYYNQRLLHVYTEPGIYQVSVKGKIGRINGSAGVALVSVDSPFPKTMQNTETYGIEYSLPNNPNLIELPEGLFENCGNAKTARSCFENCTNLMMLPGDILSYTPNITIVFDFASGCTNLRSIPAGIFDNCPLIETAERAFRRTAIEYIPEDLFVNNPLLWDLNNCFYECTKLKSIPAGLFSHNSALKAVSEAFYGCTALETLPSGLFQNSPSVYSFQSMFQNCTALTEIPGDFLDGIVYDGVWTLRFNSMFQGCSALTGIPGALFQDIPDGSNFGQCFEGCSGITGAVPNLWETHPNSNGYRCFRGCTNASNYSSIPSGWK